MDQDNFFQTDQITPTDGEVDIIEFQAEPYPDHKRIKVAFRLSFFQSPPNAAIALLTEEDQVITSVDLVNIIHPENELTLHLPRSVESTGNYLVEMTLFKLEEQETQPGEDGDVKLTTHKLSTRRVAISLT